jgi:hypothetical protein
MASSSSGGDAATDATVGSTGGEAGCDGACPLTCGENYIADPDAGACIAPASRPIGPLSGSAVSTTTPTLRWTVPPGFTSARVDVCADPPCNHVVWSQDVAGTNVIVGTALTPGMNYWRLTTIDTSVDGGAPTPLVSPTWQFAVLGAHSAPFTRAWPEFADIEGDGYADFIGFFGGTVLEELRGSSTGVANVVTSSWQPATDPDLLQGGDVNGDGLSDIVVIDSEGIELLFGGPDGFPNPPGPRTTPAPSGSFSRGAAVVGDVNGDGYADLVGFTYVGGAAGLYEFNGSPAGFAQTPDVAFDLPSGASIRASETAPGVMGDVNGDGYADVLVTDPDFGSNGGAWVFLGSSAGLSATPAYTLVAPTGATNFGDNGDFVNGPWVGGTVTTDVNGDGYPEVFISAGLQGVYMYAGSSTGYQAPPSASILAGSATGIGDIWGFAGGGDINGDGYGDLVLADDGYASGYGQVDVFLGGPSGLPATPSQTLLSSNIAGYADAGGGGSVQSIALLGDVNGDARSDFVVNDYFDTSIYGLGALYLGSSNISQTPAFSYTESSETQNW